VGLAFRIEAPERVVMLGVLLLAVGVLDHIREPVLESCSMPLSGRFADGRGLIRSWSTLMAAIVLPLIRVAHTDHNADR